jgi:uncharacterized protein YacL
VVIKEINKSLTPYSVESETAVAEYNLSKSARLHKLNVENVRGATGNEKPVELEDKKLLG